MNVKQKTATKGATRMPTPTKEEANRLRWKALFILAIPVLIYMVVNGIIDAGYNL